MTYLTIAQYAIAAALVGYGVFVGAQQLRGRFGRRTRTPVDDLRLVIDLAARLRDQGKTEAVAVCQQLLDELLKPEAPKS
jgi:hypothetical protein